ncbi:hypothetical protein GGD63_007914 [Bradyrhizobium sp. cir1]|uniref:hypothetical protein n=1 Tax=Bradyrhizobium sp. cir1 TaxID=1445730 RepID=UPI001606CB87|nr:hypothetical protein [Bradyrhizobium sp. cir1]MBB4375070.1 hypothetical protein [Bradyrhizobium sp. cir1]
MDVVDDQLSTGHKLCVLTMIDTFSRFSPTLAPWFTFRGSKVMEALGEVDSAEDCPSRAQA